MSCRTCACDAPISLHQQAVQSCLPIEQHVLTSSCFLNKLKSILETRGVNNNSFRRFMDPSTYKGKWSGCQNGTYWAAAKLLARVAHEQEQAKKSAKKGKRKSAEGTSSAKRAKTDAAGGGGGSAAAAAAAPRKKTAAEAKAEASRLIERIKAVEGVPEGAVYDTCSQLVAKIKSFLERDGVTKAALLSALGDINSNSLTRFLAGKKQDQCGSVVYRSSYVFFEKLRILEGAPKSAARKKNEAENPDGVSCRVPVFVLLELAWQEFSHFFRPMLYHDPSSFLSRRRALGRGRFFPCSPANVLVGR